MNGNVGILYAGYLIGELEGLNPQVENRCSRTSSVHAVVAARGGQVSMGLYVSFLAWQRKSTALCLHGSYAVSRLN